MSAATTYERRSILPGVTMNGGVIANRYRFEKLIGVGASSYVVRAHHVHLRTLVRLKLLTGMTERIQAAHAAAGVAGILDAGVTPEGTPFIATRYVEGPTLEEVPEDAIRTVMKACVSLARAHVHGLVHGNLKPSNILVTGEVLDFGMGAPVTDEGDFKPEYLSPEQLMGGEVDARTDVWTLGVILHQAISGVHPFAADCPSAQLIAIATQDAPLLRGVPDGVATAVRACLAKNPAARPNDAMAVARALAPYCPGGVALAARVEKASEIPPEPTKTRGVYPKFGPPEKPRLVPSPAAPPPAEVEKKVTPIPGLTQKRWRGALAMLFLSGVAALALSLSDPTPRPGVEST